MPYWTGESHSSEAKGPKGTPHWQDVAAIFANWGERRLPFIGGIDVRLAHQLPGKPAAGAGGKRVGSY